MNDSQNKSNAGGAVKVLKILPKKFKVKLLTKSIILMTK
jgi:hypothetical protein